MGDPYIQSIDYWTVYQQSWIMVIQRSHKAYSGLKFSKIGRILNYKSLTYHIDILVYIIISINYDIEVSTRADLGLNLWSVVIFTVLSDSLPDTMIFLQNDLSGFLVVLWFWLESSKALFHIFDVRGDHIFGILFGSLFFVSLVVKF